MPTILIILSLVMVTHVTSAQELKILTFNIRYDNPADNENAWTNRKEDMIDFLNKQKADVMGFQEVLYNQLNYLNENLPDYNYVGVGREDGKTKGEFSPLFYRKDKFMVEKYFTVWLSETPDVPSRGWDAALERIATFAVLKIIGDEKRILVVNTHYDHRGEVARAESSKLILKKIEEVNSDRVVLMGDLNTGPDSTPVMTFIDGKFRDTYSCKNDDSPSITFAGFENTNYDSGNRIDYVFVKELDCLSYRILTPRTKSGNLSDHLPVIVKVK